MTTEEQIEALLKNSEIELRKISRALPNVGNRPYYPMFILWDASFTGAEFSEFGEISTRLKRLWPNAFRYLTSFSYQITDEGEICYFTLPDKQEADLKTIRDTLSREQRARDVFAEMGQWRLYNVVDTSRFQSLKEFQIHYEALQTFQTILNDASRSMLLVLLDDSRNRRETAGEIRKFLSRQHGVYDSTVLISNLTRDNFETEDSYQITAGILLLSNNDAIFDASSSDFKRRSSVFYNGGTFVVSYQSMERPNHDIALQIHQTILDAAQQEALSDAPEWQSWNGFLTTDPGRSGYNSLCEEVVRDWPVKVESEIFEYLPLRTFSAKMPAALSALTYGRLKQHTFGGILDHLAEEYGGERLFDGDGKEAAKRRADQMARRWQKDALKRRALSSFRELTDEQIAGMVGELENGAPREIELAQRYFEECIRVQVRKQILYPRLKEAVIDLRAQAVRKAETLIALQDAYRQLIPARGFGHIGTIYAQAAREFLREPAGQEYIQRICSQGEDVQAILDQMLECFRKLVARNREQFSLSFTDEWMRRLHFEQGQNGNRNIYRTISSVLTSREDNLFHLRGNYPLGDKQLRVFLLHTADIDGSHPTELYENLRTAFSSDQILQYVNTGYAGTLEAFTLLACEGENLLV